MSALDGVPETAWLCPSCGAWSDNGQAYLDVYCPLCGAARPSHPETLVQVTVRRLELRSGEYLVCLDGRGFQVHAALCAALWNTLKGVAGVTLTTIVAEPGDITPPWRVLHCSEVKRA